MKTLESKRLGSIPAYPFAEIRKKAAALKEAGVDVIDLGVGDPVRPTPAAVRAACAAGLDRYAASGYPPYRGTAGLLDAVAAWMKRAIGAALDPSRETLATIGSKEAIFHLAAGIVDPGDRVLVPSPGYPPYTTGTLFAGGEPVCYPLDAAAGFLPDLDVVRRELAGGRVKLMWICTPNSPTGAVWPRAFVEELAGVLREAGVALASDEAYCDFVFEGEHASPLAAGAQGVISFYSLSKRSNMTGYRVGWVAGDARLVGILQQVKTNIDSGTPCFVQDAAAAALADDAAVDAMRAEYRRGRDALAGALAAAGLEECRPRGALYVWQKAPPGMTSVELAEALLHPSIAVVAIPGRYLAGALPDGRNPGDGHVRLSLTALPERVEEASRRIRAHLPAVLAAVT